MPAIRFKVTATTTDALSGRQFKVQNRPALVSIWASAAAAADVLSFSVGSNSYAVDLPMNLESANEAIDTDRDQLLFRERVPAGEYFMPMTLAGADASVLINIEPV